jgi:hypothetical protein
MRSEHGQYHNLRRKLSSVGRVAIEKQTLVIADDRRVNPGEMKHAPAVDSHRRTVRASSVVIGVRDLLGVAEVPSRVCGNRKKDLHCPHAVFAEQAAILEGNVHVFFESNDGRFMNIALSKVAEFDGLGE